MLDVYWVALCDVKTADCVYNIDRVAVKYPSSHFLFVIVPECLKHYLVCVFDVKKKRMVHKFI